MKPTSQILAIIAFLSLPLAHAAPAIAVAAFPGAGGNYGGIVQPDDNDPLNAGIISLQLLDTGSFTGSATITGGKYPFSGKFNASTSQFSDTFPAPPGLLFDAIDVDATLDSVERTIVGTLVGKASGTVVGSSTFTLSGARPDPVLGPKLTGSIRTSFIDPPNVMKPSGLVAGPQEIPGDGFALVTVGNANSRAARFVGRLNDYNGKFSSGSPLRGANYTVLGSLYKKISAATGQAFGQADVLDNGSDSPGLSSMLNWGKAAGTGYYDAGINTGIFINGQVYPHVGPGQIVPIGADTSPRVTATIRFKRGNMIANFEAPLALSPGRAKVADPNPNAVTVKINAQKGLFKGTFIHPDSGQLTKFQGAFQSAIGQGLPGAVVGEGRGSFAGTIDPNNANQPTPVESGSVRITVNLTP